MLLRLGFIFEEKGESSELRERKPQSSDRRWGYPDWKRLCLEAFGVTTYLAKADGRDGVLHVVI